MKKKESRLSLIIIFVQSLIAMLGSLYYSNFGDPVANMKSGELFLSTNGLDPCNLCWWARILMYPIVLLSAMAFWSKEKSILKYIRVLAVLGIGLETYHYFLQKVNVSTSMVCTMANPCEALKVDYFGFITIPLLCLTAFVVIFVASVWKKKS